MRRRALRGPGIERGRFAAEVPELGRQAMIAGESIDLRPWNKVVLLGEASPVPDEGQILLIDPFHGVDDDPVGQRSGRHEIGAGLADDHDVEAAHADPFPMGRSRTHCSPT